MLVSSRGRLRKETCESRWNGPVLPKKSEQEKEDKRTNCRGGPGKGERGQAQGRWNGLCVRKERGESQGPDCIAGVIY